MSYKLEYPYTEQEKLDFIVQYNHQQGLRIETVDNIIEEERAQEFTEEREVLDEEGNVIGIETAVVDTETYYEAVNYPTHYALEANEIMGVNEEGLSLPIINPNYEVEQEQKERERIAKLYLTGADVERGIYKAKGMDFDDILAFVMANPPQGLDIKALKIELKANHFYRGNPYVNAVGTLLGFTSEQLDKFFETNDYTYLISEPVVDNSEPVDEENSVVTEIEPNEV